ncbi:[acyl-carrier-protein] S-malonyltransferase [Microbacterium endophyticum]|uniref:[acyl-carrier-protein] S-malonyltransferase n=1 Tax=Microbacterium endophyticum TaxID=1526412 RepID=A0A7W4V083_9MICO|nr:ACP S-malonyltransferase [Microbacterium endophyticum]MBB2974488.1 [acyl-carrier-protein] S-malonyltransferase [Microbacterium endophyticum]NIK36785.1 [acyl-carrier-protein] S-malonyltransferase [Microbacterium endophyticum]
MIIALFPGQGSQTPGFLSPWLEIAGARERLVEFSDAAGVDLIAAGTEWDADRIRDTAVAQPLIVAASILSFEALGQRAPVAFDGMAGHSVGEVAALVASGVLSAVDGMALVGIRGRSMAEAATSADTGMSAVIGGVEADVLAALANAELTPANYNGPGQIVAAGARDGLNTLAESAPRGTRVIPLQVAGAFHTEYMAPAVGALRDAAASVTAADPNTTLWTNRDGSVVADGAAALSLLVNQVSSPVRWDLCMESFAAAGVTGLIEFAPAGTLTGLAKRGLKGIPAVAVKSPDDLSGAIDLVKGTAA